jgi:hypothetical protein
VRGSRRWKQADAKLGTFEAAAAALKGLRALQTYLCTAFVGAG